MTTTEYERILSMLAAVSHVLDANQGELNPADIRIRCLVNITVKEARRARLEARHSEQREAGEKHFSNGATVAQPAESHAS